jgi:hypothetical protein
MKSTGDPRRDAIRNIIQRDRESAIDDLIKKEEESSSFWIIKDSENNYYCNGKKVITTGKQKYIKILDVVYSLIPQGGQKSYSEIIKLAKIRKIQDMDKRSIQKALTAKSSYLYKNTGISFIVGNGIPLFVADPDGKFLMFNNKK